MTPHRLAGSTQIMELGNIESPIILTNTLNVCTGIDAVVKYTLSQKGNEHVQSVNAFMGLAKTGGIASNGSGDYVIALSTAANLRIAHETSQQTETQELINNDYTSPLFMAAIEATEEAFISSTTKAIIPVSTLDSKTIGNGQGGTVARRLFELLQEQTQLQIAGNKR